MCNVIEWKTFQEILNWTLELTTVKNKNLQTNYS
jgi:hypothetical protein